MAKRFLPFYFLTFLLFMASCGELTDYEIPKAIQATNMELGRHSIDIMVGDRFEIPTVFTPDSVSNMAVFWQSADDYIATFEDNVLVALSVGTTTVKAIAVSEQFEDSCQVNVIPRWELNPTLYPYDMVIYADVLVHGVPANENMMIGAVCDGELRGLGELKSDHGRDYVVIRVWSPFEYGDIITIGCYYKGYGLVEYFPDEFVFDGEAHGTLSNLYPLHIN